MTAGVSLISAGNNIASNTYIVKWTASTAGTTNSTNVICDYWDDSTAHWVSVASDELELPSHVRRVRLKDGSILHVDEKGNFHLDDKAAKVIYAAHRNKDFNPYVNAGELVGSFIDYIRQSIPGVKRSDIPTLPLELFVNWLVLEAAERDGDPAPSDVTPLPNSRLLVARIKPRCSLPTCRRFIPRSAFGAGFNYCSPSHATRHARLIAA